MVRVARGLQCHPDMRSLILCTTAMLGLACGPADVAPLALSAARGKADSAEFEGLGPDRVSYGDPIRCQQPYGLTLNTTLFEGIRLVRLPIKRETFNGSLRGGLPLWLRFEVRVILGPDWPVTGG